MKTMFKGLSAGVLSLASLGALSTAPAIASSLTGASIGGSASGDYIVYDANATTTFPVAKTFANVQTVLSGNAANPTGNVELRANTEQAGFNATEFGKNTTLEGSIGGKSIVLSSLIKSDWDTPNYNGSGKTFGRYWFESALANAITLAGNPFLLPFNDATKTVLFNTFVGAKGFERFSDPNISYVNQDNNSGKISIGLAGHYNALSVLFNSDAIDNLQNPLKAIVKGVLSNQSLLVQASEVVKYSYEGKTDYLYSFNATRTGLVGGDDGTSHSGNYEVTFQGTKPVPVPAGFVGIALAGVIGGGMMKRRKLASKA